MALTKPKGLFCSRVKQGGAMVRPVRHSMLIWLLLKVGGALPAVQVQREVLRGRVQQLLAAVRKMNID